MRCVLNQETGNTNTLVGGGDGTVSFINQSLNKVGVARTNEERDGRKDADKLVGFFSPGDKLLLA